MTVTSDRSIVINFTGDVEFTQEFESTTSTTSPGQNQLVSVTTGLVVTVPTGSSGVTIIPPTTNTTAMTIKGVTGDTGIGLGLVSPSSLALSTTSTTFILAAASTISNVRLIFS